MKLQVLLPLLVAATIIAASVGVYTHSIPLLGQSQDQVLPPFTPPLQNGHIDLQGKYIVSTLHQVNATHINIQANYNGPEASYAMPKNKLITHILVSIVINDVNQLGIKITDRTDRRFEVPYNNLFPHDKVFNFPANNQFDITLPKRGEAFYLTIKRKDTNEVVFDSNNQFFVYSDLYHEFTVSMQNEFIYGLGERRNRQFLYDSGEYTFLNKDQYMQVDDGYPNQQTYGTHPMYLRRENSGNFHVVFLRNYNSIQAVYNKGKSLTYKVVGGLLEFKIFLGDKSPETSLKLYHSYVNGFNLHPFWAHGFHQCRWGYKTSEMMTTVWNTFNQNGLPFDTIWSDIDYMKELTDFTIDTSRYDKVQMNTMLDRSVAAGVHWVPIIDAGIALGDVSNERGKELGVYQKSNKTGEDLIGCVWPGKVNYPDFNHPLSQEFWAEGLMNLTKNYDITPSGFWIDMNEFSNFINGEISEEQNCAMPADPNYLGNSVEDFYTRIPFEVGGADHPQQEKTMSYDAPKYNYADAKTVYIPHYQLREFDFHNLNGFSEGIATNYALKKMGNKLPFIISRSQIAGSGQFVQHWTGDNGSQWNFLQYSLGEIFNFNMYGIPMTGADICGFAQNTTAELCARWMQVGAFYPFSRNHNSNDTISQEPYAFPDYSYVLDSSKKSLKLRYALLKQYYSHFVSSNGVGTVFRPTFFNFPDDVSLLSNDQQFMIGDSLLGQPVLVQSATPEDKVTPLTLTFPSSGAFYDFITDVDTLYAQRYTNANNGQIKKVKFDDIMPLYIREGYTVFTQLASTALRSRLLDNNFELHIALAKSGTSYTAKGKFITIQDYSDDNLIQKCIGANNCSFDIEVTGVVNGAKLDLTIQVAGESTQTNFETINVNKIISYAADLRFATPTATFTISKNGTINVSIPLQTTQQE